MSPTPLDTRRAMTLMELLVTSIIVSIALAGIGMASYAIMKMDKDQTRDSSMYMQLAAVAEKIRFDAARAMGDAADWGIKGGGNDSCFRYQQEPSNLWNCYASQGTTLYFCAGKANPVDCSTQSDKKVLASIVANGFSTTMGAQFIAWRRYDFTLTTRKDPAAAQSADNPEAKVSYRVYPEQHSF